MGMAATIAKLFPDMYETWFYFSDTGYKLFLDEIRQEFSPEQQTQCASHRTAPFVWFEYPHGGKPKDPNAWATFDDDKQSFWVDMYDVKGGRDTFCKWAGKEFPNHAEIQA